MSRSFRRLFKTCGYSSTQHLEPMSEETTSEQFVVANESGSEFETLHNQSRYDSGSTLVCCKSQGLRDNQMDLCPKIWCDICCEEDEHEESRLPFLTICWRFFFVATCFPLCYCCYVTRSSRRVKRRDNHRWRINKNLDENLRGSKRNSKSSTFATNHVKVNIIILQSDSSKVFQTNWCGEDENDWKDINRLSSNIKLRKKSHQTQSEDTSNYAPALARVEEVSENPLIPHIEVTAPNGKKLSANQRWSRVGNAVAKLATTFRSSKVVEERIVNDNSGDCAVQSEGLDVKPSLRSSSLSAGSLYYSFEDEANENTDYLATDNLVHLKSMGKRRVYLKDIDMHFVMSFFDEDSVNEWSGANIRVVEEPPNFDIVLVAVKEGSVTEICDILDMSTGLMSHLSAYWRGFFPLLLMRINPENVSDENHEFNNEIKKLSKYFNEVYTVKFSQQHIDNQHVLIDECIGRLFMHSRIFQCPRFYAKNRLTMNQCSGGCGLSTSQA